MTWEQVRCRTPGVPPKRNPVGYNLLGLHGDGHSQECPNRQVQMLPQDIAHLNDVPVFEPI